MAKQKKSEIKTAVKPAPVKETPKTERKQAPEQLLVSIDYPQQDEGITSNEYTIRIGTQPTADKVEVAIDRGPWLSCRQAEGYFWYDWSNFAPGVHRLTARALTANGDSGVSAQRRVQILKK